MTHLLPNTIRRLQKLPQTPTVWEGDRRPIPGKTGAGLGDFGAEVEGECILWVDTTEGIVRGMDVVSGEMGMEALVRTLVHAIESPHGPAQPSLPQKIVVRNREFQFFLRGALQDLNITVDYVPELHLIDEILRSFESMGNGRPPNLPALYEKPLTTLAQAIWEAAPWEELADHDIIAVELNAPEPKTLYLCVMGMLGQEFGILLYRSLDSLTEFRRAAIHDRSNEQLEQAFLAQDCWFLNYESTSDDEDEEAIFDEEEIIPLFGSVHPYEGIRPFLDDDEAQNVLLALEGFLRFYRSYERQLGLDEVPALRKRYRIALSKGAVETVTVFTQPELSAVLLEMGHDGSSAIANEEGTAAIQDNLVPDNAVLSLGVIPWDVLASLRSQPKTYYQDRSAVPRGEGMPIVIIQTSRPKAKELIKAIQGAGGLEAICFNPGEDPWSGEAFDLGLLKTGNGTLYLFGEFSEEDPKHQQARKKWDQRSQTTQGYCGLVIAMGVTGNARGKPQITDMLAFFEAQSLTSQDLDLGVLQLVPHLDF